MKDIFDVSINHFVLKYLVNMAFWFVLIQILPVLALFYFIYYRPKLNYWPSRGLKGPTPLPLVGNFFEQIWKGQPAAEMDWYRKYGKVYGSFQSTTPALTILDHELIKQVLVKDFNNFVNRRKVRGDHEIWSRNLFNLENDDWKRVRTITSPTFTSGKLRGMNALMNRCVEKLNAYLDNLCIKSDGVLNTKEIVSGFTIDVIASTSFATETNSNDDRSKKNAFVEHGMKLLQIPFTRLLGFMLIPESIRQLLNMKLAFEPEHFDFFRDLAKQVVKQRKEGGQSAKKRSDLVQLLMDASVSDKELNNSNYESLTADDHHEEITEPIENGQHKSEPNNKTGKALDDNEIIAQCILFFIAGFETTATTITFCLFELSRNPDVQERLNDELKQSLDGIPTDSNQYYETVLKIPYLEAVIKETLRKYPPVVRLERRVNVNGYKLAGIELEKQDLVNIPTFAVHRIPEYYPEPERFNPDRFMPENKHLLVPYTYLPFGQGPRNCIGMRFAYQEIKLLLARMVPKFKFTPTVETPKALKFRRVGLLNTKPFQLNVVKR